MSGTPKKGLDYAGWATNIFDSESSPIDGLLDSQGWIGFGIYFFLCQRAYSTDGYYYRWSYNNAASTARKMGGGVKAETVKQVVSLCLQNGLFDNELFDREGILTSKMIQERFMIAVEKRSQSGRTVNGKYWLLDSKETRAYIVILENAHSLPENVHSLPENATKESKVNKRKVNESSTRASSLDTAVLEADIWAKYGAEPPTSACDDDYDDTTIRPIDGIGRGVVMLSNQQITQLLNMMSRSDFEGYVKQLAHCIADKGYTVRSHYNTICRWYKEDKGT